MLFIPIYVNFALDIKKLTYVAPCMYLSASASMESFLNLKAAVSASAAWSA